MVSKSSNSNESKSSKSENDWNIDEFNEKIINPNLIAPIIGEGSGTHRDFNWEKSLQEYEPIKKEAQRWIGAADKRIFQKIINPLLKTKSTQFKEPISTFPNYTFPPNKTPQMFAIGQSHLDLGYRWRYLQSTEKIRVTGEKAIFHIEKVPEFSFTISQPAMLEWTLHKYPELFKKFQKAADTGRLELAGGSYVEPDTHLISGESWCRQRLYGQLFYRKYFNRISEIEWVPDSFGFTSSIPQLIARSGGKYFFTLKMNWNDTTCFPFSIFWWQSPDGSRILTRSLSGYQRKKLLTNWDQFASTALLLNPGIRDNIEPFNYESTNLEDFLANPPADLFSREMIPYEIFLYGQSDGGHGPRGIEVQSHLAMHRQGLLTLSTASEYYKKVEQEFGDRLPVWQDEMYLEYHRGTLTTSPIIKRMNRFNEWILPALEKLSLIAHLNGNAEFPQKAFDECWKFTLLQQFHDVLPGSHPPELLDDAWAIWRTQKEKYQNILTYVWDQIDAKILGPLPKPIKAMVKNESEVVPILLFNPTSFIQNARIEISLENLPVEFDINDDAVSKCNGNSNINAKQWVILSKMGELCPLSFLNPIECSNDFYALPRRISFLVSNLPGDSISIVFLTSIDNLLNAKIEIDDDQSSKELHSADTENSITISNSLVQLKFDKQTGGCISLKYLYEGNWLETINQNSKHFQPDLPELNPGILPQAYYEYSGVYAAWDLFPKSYNYPYPILCEGMKISSLDHNHISLKIQFELRTPPESKIEAGKKKKFLDKNADQTGRRDPDVIPIFPSLEEFTDISKFAFEYTLYRNDPKVMLTVESDFHAHDTIVKLDIPTATNACRITSEIAYGIDNRSTLPTTSRDKARWENIMHTWINLQSEDNSWGFGVINNCKYGMSVHGGFLGITLIRGKKYPDPFFNLIRKSWLGYERKKRKKAGLGEPPKYTSQGSHIWQFILFPHGGSPEHTDLLPQAHLFNSPVMSYISKKQDKISTSSIELSALKLSQTNFPIEISTIKLPHPDGDAYNWFGQLQNNQKVVILRAMNWSKCEVSSAILLDSLPVKEIHECDLLERKIDQNYEKNIMEIPITTISAKWKAFEVKTFAILLEY